MFPMTEDPKILEPTCARPAPLPADLSNLESRLRQLTIQSDPAAVEQTKRLCLERFASLQTAKSNGACVSDSLIDEQLAEAIINCGEQRVTLSLRQYVNSVRYVSAAWGAIAGLVLGVVLSTFSFYTFSNRDNVNAAHQRASQRPASERLYQTESEFASERFPTARRDQENYPKVYNARQYTDFQ